MMKKSLELHAVFYNGVLMEHTIRASEETAWNAAYMIPRLVDSKCGYRCRVVTVTWGGTND